MTFVRRAAVWIGRIGRRTPEVDAFLGMLDQMDELKSLTDMIKTANDPPQTLEVLGIGPLTKARMDIMTITSSINTMTIGTNLATIAFRAATTWSAYRS